MKPLLYSWNQDISTPESWTHETSSILLEPGYIYSWVLNPWNLLYTPGARIYLLLIPEPMKPLLYSWNQDISTPESWTHETSSVLLEPGYIYSWVLALWNLFYTPGARIYLLLSPEPMKPLLYSWNQDISTPESWTRETSSILLEPGYIYSSVLNLWNLFYTPGTRIYLLPSPEPMKPLLYSWKQDISTHESWTHETSSIFLKPGYIYSWVLNPWNRFNTRL